LIAKKDNRKIIPANIPKSNQTPIGVAVRVLNIPKLRKVGPAINLIIWKTDKTAKGIRSEVYTDSSLLLSFDTSRETKKVAIIMSSRKLAEPISKLWPKKDFMMFGLRSEEMMVDTEINTIVFVNALFGNDSVLFLKAL
jgi:hypothetical protein